jgi:glycosyltransferase involved in cell wall biosynthesis
MLRMGFPYDFSLSASRRTAVFGTSELQVIEKAQCKDDRTYEALRRGVAPSQIKIVTPSRWSAKGFHKAGFRPEQIHVIPHGVDIATFHAMPEMRAGIRSELSIPDSDFVFLNVSAMTATKGIDLLLLAFAEVSRKFPHVCLVLKGLDPLYNSKDRFLQIIGKMPADEQQRVLGRIRYL